MYGTNGEVYDPGGDLVGEPVEGTDGVERTTCRGGGPFEGTGTGTGVEVRWESVSCVGGLVWD